MAISCHTHALAALSPGKEPSDMHSFSDWVDTRTGLDASQKRLIICSCWESNNYSSGVLSIASKRYRVQYPSFSVYMKGTFMLVTGNLLS